ncbi:MAG: aldehyde dehydrogenase family protein [Syntrophobacteraceae bacterium]
MGDRKLPTYACWIHGKDIKNGKFYPLVDPATGELFAQATSADASMVDSALNGALKSACQWRNITASQRASVLHKFAERIRGEIESLSTTISVEVGKTIQAARDEVSSAAFLLDYFAEESLRLSGEIPLLGYPREQVLIVREPVGVVVTITPFNYPLSTLARKIAPALAAGCTVVAKPDEHTPISTIRLAKLAFESGLPPGVFNVLTGVGPEVGRLLVEHPIPRLISFTGSTEVGKEIQAICSRFVRKTVMELGGQCPGIVCEDAPWRELAAQIAVNTMKNSGQYCYRISRIYVAAKIYNLFLEDFTRHVSNLKVGSGSDSSVDLGPLNNPETLSRIRSQVGTAVSEGARVEFGGNSINFSSGGYYYPPTVLTGVSPQKSILREEIFGPVAIVIPFDDLDKVITEVNASRYGLAAYVFTSDLGKALTLAGRIEAGSVWINRIHQAYPEAPFGGMKESGLGREKSHFGLEEYTELKTIYLSY